MRFTTQDGFAEYSHPAFTRDNPCHVHFVDCEGDCATCPNKDFFRHVQIEQNERVGWERGSRGEARAPSLPLEVL